MVVAMMDGLGARTLAYDVEWLGEDGRFIYDVRCIPAVADWAVPCWQGCSETEGLCGNVFRDGEMTGEGTGSSGSSRCRQEGAAGNDASEDGVASSGDVGEPTRFVLTG